MDEVETQKFGVLKCCAELKLCIYWDLEQLKITREWVIHIVQWSFWLQLGSFPTPNRC